jgi:hypothetical protein
LRPIIAFLELIKEESKEFETPHNFQEDYSKLADGMKEILAIYEKISQFEKDLNFEELSKFDQDFNKHNEALQTISYLESLSETFIFNTYRDILLIDSEMPLPDGLAEENKDLFYRLKFRALNSTRI